MEARSEISKKYLAEALIQLMKQKNFHKITNKDITSKSGLSDITIYRNFNSKEEIVRYYLSHIFNEWKNKTIIDLLYKANLQHLLIDNILELHDYKKEDPNVRAYSKVTVAYFIFGWCDEWYKRGMVETPEEMMKYFKHIKNNE